MKLRGVHSCVIRVAICDDDKLLASNLQIYLEEKNAQLQDVSLKISLYHSGEDFLQDIDSGMSFQIVFMDIQMRGLNGIEVGQRLRSRPDGDDAIMIYVSSHESYYEGVVDVGGFRFIKKPIKKDRLDDVFQKALAQAIKYKRILDTPSLFRYKTCAESQSVLTNQIVYMKSAKRVIELATWGHAERAIVVIGKFYARLEETLEQLPGELFVRCERSHVVNLCYVHRMEKDFFILSDKYATCIPIGRAYKQESKRAYFNYLEGSI